MILKVFLALKTHIGSHFENLGRQRYSRQKQKFDSVRFVTSFFIVFSFFRMPVTAGGGNVKETNKNKRKTASGEGKGNVEASTGRGGVKSKIESVPSVEEKTTATSTRGIYITPSRYGLRSTTVKKPPRNESSPPGPSQGMLENINDKPIMYSFSKPRTTL